MTNCYYDYLVDVLLWFLSETPIMVMWLPTHLPSYYWRVYIRQLLCLRPYCSPSLTASVKYFLLTYNECLSRVLSWAIVHVLQSAVCGISTTRPLRSITSITAFIIREPWMGYACPASTDPINIVHSRCRFLLEIASWVGISFVCSRVA